MSYENFNQKVWAAGIDRELERSCVFVADTNQKYTGSIKNKGDSVRILGVGRPTITDWDADTDITLLDPEKVEDTSTTLIVDRVATFNYGVGDIDKAQGANGVMEALNAETSEGIANKMDKFVADMSKDKQAKKLWAQAKQVTADNVLSLIDEALEHLYEMDVNPSGLITITVSPKFFTRLKQGYIHTDTDNSAMMKNGQVSRYGNAIIRLSNNVAKDSQGNELIQVKTQRAIAFAKAVAHTEPYRPEKKFEDAVKGFVLYGGKIVRPKEMINMNVKYTA